MTGALFALLAASSSKPASSSGSTTFIIFIVLIAVVGYFLLIRPQKQKQRRQREQQSAVGVGDEVQTVGGIVGKVIAVDPQHVTILSGGDTVGFAAAGSEPTRLVLVRNAISRKIEPVVPGMSDGALDGSADTAGTADTADADEDGDAGAFDGPRTSAPAKDGSGELDGRRNGHGDAVGDRTTGTAESESEGTST